LSPTFEERCANEIYCRSDNVVEPSAVNRLRLSAECKIASFGYRPMQVKEAYFAVSFHAATVRTRVLTMHQAERLIAIACSQAQRRLGKESVTPRPTLRKLSPVSHRWAKLCLALFL
jgi:hypothetical protein